MSETEKNKREWDRKRDTFIATSLVVASFIFLVGTIVYKEIEKSQVKQSQKVVKEPQVEDEIAKIEEEKLSDAEIDKILLEAKEKMKDSYAQAKPLFERIQDYRGEAAYYLGMGDLVEGKTDMALEKIQKAVKLGFTKAMYELGKIYMLKKNYSEAEKWFLQSEKQGEMQATERLTEIYNIEKNDVKREEKLSVLSNQKRTAYMYELGKLYIRKGEYVKAEELFTKLKDYGIIKAADRLSDIKEILKNENKGEMADKKILEQDKNLEKSDVEIIFNEAQKMLFSNPEKAKTYLEKIEKHKRLAAAYLAEYYMDKFDAENTKKWLENAAERGEVSSMYDLGQLYEEEKDYEEAEKWYKKALGKNYMIPLSRLGNIYEKKGDYKEAEKWYKKGVQNDNRGAIKSLALLYEREGNSEESEKLLIKLSEKNDFFGMLSLSEKYHNEKNYEEAEKIDKKLYELGAVDRINLIGKAEEYKKNYEEAEKWYLIGANQGNVESMLNLGIFYDKIKGGKDKEKAAEWYEKASNLNESRAMYLLAQLYQQDFNDMGLAQKWYLRALKNGRMDAKLKLKEIKDKG
jgi:tetratricopeptide repeat protein